MKRGRLLVLISIFILVVISSAFAYNYLEGWRLLDSLYFVVITVTTIGYGDFSPTHDISKVLTMFLSFFGVAMAFYLLGTIGSSLFRKHVEKQVSKIKESVKKEQEIKGEIKETIKENLGKSKKKQ